MRVDLPSAGTVNLRPPVGSDEVLLIEEGPLDLPAST